MKKLLSVIKLLRHYIVHKSNDVVVPENISPSILTSPTISVKEFHLSRIMFVYYEQELFIIGNTEMGHREWFTKLVEYNPQKFTDVEYMITHCIRGYVNKKQDIIFYKGEDFHFDGHILTHATVIAEKLMRMLDLRHAILKCGVKIGNIGEEWDAAYCIKVL